VSLFYFPLTQQELSFILKSYFSYVVSSVKNLSATLLIDA